MRAKNIIPFVALLACSLAACLADGAPADEPPVRADHLKTRDGKPPMKFHSVRLTLANRHDRPVWIILPYWGDEPLPANGTFPGTGWKDRPFGGKQYDGEGGAAIEVAMWGMGRGFRAFRLPAKGKLELDGYSVEAWKDIDQIAVIEARELKVNGMTPLEKWLPYQVTSGKGVKVGRKVLGGDWKNLDWDPKAMRERADHPSEVVKEVKAEGIHSWTVKFQRARKGP